MNSTESWKNAQRLDSCWSFISLKKLGQAEPENISKANFSHNCKFLFQFWGERCCRCSSHWLRYHCHNRCRRRCRCCCPRRCCWRHCCRRCRLRGSHCCSCGSKLKNPCESLWNFSTFNRGTLFVFSRPWATPPLPLWLLSFPMCLLLTLLVEPSCVNFFDF